MTKKNYPFVKKTLWMVLAIFVFTFLYAVTRYVILGPYDFKAIPLFITNKALAFSFVINLMILSSPKIKNISRMVLGLFTYLMGILHGILSVILLPTSFFEKFYDENGEMYFDTGAMVFFGVLAIILMIVINKYFHHYKQEKSFWNSFVFEKLYLVFLIALGLHLFVSYMDGWFVISNWYGYMPPISLLSFIAVLISTINFFQRVFCVKR